jgi:hypothetical protein
MKGLSGKLFSQGLNFFPVSRSYKMTSNEGLTFFLIFFELVKPDLRPTWNDNAWKLLLAPRRCGFLFFPHLLVKKWHVVDPKMIIAKNQEVYFLVLKCKTTPVPTKSAGTCTKFKKYLRRLTQQNESWYAYPRWSTIYVGCFHQLSISHFSSCFTKNPNFGTPKI